MSQKLICTAELDLPEDPLAASKAQTALLEFWEQFKTALPEQGLSGVRVDSRIVKSKPKDGKKTGETETNQQKSTPPQQQQPASQAASAEMPAFLRR